MKRTIIIITLVAYTQILKRIIVISNERVRKWCLFLKKLSVKHLAFSIALVPVMPFLAVPTFAQSTHQLTSGLNTCLDAAGQSPNVGANVSSWSCHGGKNQQWRFDGKKLVNGGGLCLDINAKNNNMIVWTCHGGQNQQWSLSGSRLKNAGGKCADISGGSNKDGANIIAYSCHGGKNQQWILGAGVNLPTRNIASTRVSAPKVFSSVTMNRLHCSNTTEVGADDGVYYKVYVDGAYKFTSGRRRMNEDMDSDEWHIENWPINRTWKYDKTLKIEFFEYDGGGGDDDFLGRRTFTNYEKNGNAVIRYNDDADGRYELHVTIKASGTDNIDGFLAPQSAFTSHVGNYSCKVDPVKTRANPDPDTGSACSLPTDWKDGFINDLNNKRFHNACVIHDLCYSAPWKAAGRSNGQSKCDVAFRRDMGDICETIYKDRFLGDADPEMIACKSTAGLMSTSVMAFGKDSYNGGQTWATNNCTILD